LDNKVPEFFSMLIHSTFSNPIFEDKFQYKPSIYAKFSQVISYRYSSFTSYMRVYVLAISSSPVLST